MCTLSSFPGHLTTLAFPKLGSTFTVWEVPLDPFGSWGFIAEQLKSKNRAIKIDSKASYGLCLIFKWKSFQNGFGKFRQLSFFNCGVCLCQHCFSLLFPASFFLLHQPLIKAQSKLCRMILKAYTES
jgi:hypothetical protein